MKKGYLITFKVRDCYTGVFDPVTILTEMNPLEFVLEGKREYDIRRVILWAEPVELPDQEFEAAWNELANDLS